MREIKVPNSLSDIYIKSYGPDGSVNYYWESQTVGESEPTAPGVKISIRWWYPGWLVGLILKYKLWRIRK